MLGNIPIKSFLKGPAFSAPIVWNVVGCFLWTGPCLQWHWKSAFLSWKWSVLVPCQCSCVSVTVMMVECCDWFDLNFCCSFWFRCCCCFCELSVILSILCFFMGCSLTAWKTGQGKDRYSGKQIIMNSGERYSKPLPTINIIVSLLLRSCSEQLF